LKSRALALIVLLLLSSALTPAIALAGGDGILPRVRPMADPPVWSDSFDDLSHVYIPTGGLVGVEVMGGEARLKAGSSEGWIASSIITCPADWRYDLVLIDALLPGKSHINVTILDATKAPTGPAFANATVTGLVNISATDVSLTKLDRASYPSIRVQVNLFADGADRPRLLAWRVLFGSPGEWRDDFIGTGKVLSSSGINITEGAARLGQPVAGHDPYPAIVLNSDISDLDVFYPNSAGDGYLDRDTIARTSIAGGMDVDDLNGDGFLDLIFAMQFSSGTLSSGILWGSASGTWSTASMQALDNRWSGSDVATGDLDGDGDRDVVICCPDGIVATESYIYLNQGNGTFNRAPSITLKGIAGTSVDAGDINEDGYDDIIIVNSRTYTASCFFGGSTGPDQTLDIKFCSEITTHKFIGEVLIEDVTGDGHLDVLFATQNDNDEIPIYLGSDSGIDNIADIELKVSNPPARLAAGDVNGDGRLDLAYSTQDPNMVNDVVVIYEGSATGWDEANPHTITSDIVLVPIALVDVNVDGYDDVITADSKELDIYMGGTTWPSKPTITKTGLSNPDDIVVMVASDGAPEPLGELVTEPIPLPDGMRWDILYIQVDVPSGAELLVSVLGSDEQPIPGLDKLARTDVDLSMLKDSEPIHVKLELKGPTGDASPVVDYLLVNWVDRFAWREQFYGKAKFASALGLDVADYSLSGPMDTSDRPDLLFASLRGDFAYDTRSVAFLADAGPSYTSPSAIQFNTTGASAVDAYDVDGDGIPDLAFASYGSADGSYAATSPLFLGSPDGWYQQPYNSFQTTGAMGVAIRDLNGDGFADVVFAQERDFAGPMVNSTLFWGSASGWNDTPDVEFKTAGASDVEAVDLSGDGMLDLVFACYEDDQGVATDSMVFLQTAAGFAGGAPSYLLPTVGARAVAYGDLNKDGQRDLVFANSYNGATSTTESFVYSGKAGGGFNTVPQRLTTLGAVDVEVADLDGDGNSDLVFANSRNATGGIQGLSYVLFNPGNGQFGTARDQYLPTTGASAVAVADLDGVGPKDIVFASLNNETGYGAPSVVYLGVGSGWPSSPSFELTTVGAMDVLPIHLSDPARGGYLSQAITPDATDDIGVYDTLAYSATLGAGVTGTIRIVDAATGETVYTAPLGVGDGSLDLSFAIDYMKHPSVRVRVLAEGMSGPSGFALDDLWLNWTKRVKAAPVIHGMDLTNTTCYRGHSVELQVDVLDEYTATSALDVRVEHLLEDETEWKTYMLGAPTFSDGLWRCLVSPDRLVPVGNYYFRVNVTDSDGLFTGWYGMPKLLRVLPNLPLAPHTVTATPGDREVLVGWLPPADWGDVPVEAYQVWRGATAADLALVATVAVPTVTYRDTNVTNGVILHYGVKAVNYLGVSPMSEVVNATPKALPSEPRGLNTAIGSGRVTLTWEAPLSDGGKPVTGYRVYRSANGGASTMIAEVASLTYEDTGLTNGVVYSYRVSALTETGEGPRCGPVNAIPLGPPSEVRELAVTEGARNLTLTWRPPLDTGGAAVLLYIVYRGDAEDGLGKLNELPSDANSFKDEGVLVGHTYYYAVVAVTIAGEGPRGQVASGMALDRPGQPQGLVATAGDGNVTLNWTAPTSDGASPITGYIVMRGPSAISLVELAQLGVVTTFVDTAVTNGQTYYYAVIASNGVGRGEPCAPVSAKPLKQLLAPGKVANLIFSVKDGKVTLQWTAPTSDGGSPVIGYVVLRGTSAGNMTQLADLGLVTSHTDTSAKRGTTYYYTVVAKNAVGQGEPFAAQEVKVPKAAKKSPGLEAPAALLAIAAVTLACIARRRRN